MCGEQWELHNGTICRCGSSPRVRGTGLPSPVIKLRARFIPACAGNRARPAAFAPVVPVHPRVCGEQIRFGSVPPALCGSSPRVRGTEAFCFGSVSVCRFIPACAGNSVSIRSTNLVITVHPRVCGEQATARTPPRSRRGSSPRVRGTGYTCCPVSVQRRFIPACAGNSPTIVPAAYINTVHPRVCGEQRRKLNQHVLETGSSPRVRGTGVAQLRVAFAGRFIPACAGNSARSTPLAAP